MQIVPLESVTETMVLGRTVWVDGRPLLREGVRISPRLIARLRDLGIRTVYVRTDDDQEAPAATDSGDVVSEATRVGACRAIRGFIESVQKDSVADMSGIHASVNMIIDEVLANRTVLIQLGEIRALNDYLFDHSVGVCVKSVLLGIHAGLSPKDLKTLATGALLHDLGKVQIPDAISNKPSALTPEEYDIVQQHTVLGFEMLRRQRGLSILAAHIAYQHHERFDGNGYPRNLVGSKIHRFARIVAIIDVFDALTSDRPHRAAWSFPQALGYIAQNAGTAFDPDVARAFIARVAPYPVGFHVRLNTGETCVVTRLNPQLPSRPVIRDLETGTEIDLSAQLGRRIVGFG